MVTPSSLGGPIFAGLRRALSEPRRTKPVAGQGAGRASVDGAVRQQAATQPGAPDQAGRPLGDIVSSLIRRGRTWADLTIRLAANRAMSPNSVTSISLLLGLCAAAWFSGGTRQDDVRGLITTGAWMAVRAGARQLAEATGPSFSWFYAVCATAGECAIYGGIAAGAESAGWAATWPLAIAIVIVGSVAAVARACGSPGRVRGALAWLTALPTGVLVLLAALITVSYTPRIALVAVLALGLVSLAGSLRTAAASAVRDMVVACRDDGPLARRAGWLVRGHLMPVPSAIAGVVAIGLLALLGIRNLPGIVALTPVVVLLLAAPGSSHPHDGRFDWLAPVLLCLAQYGYLATLGAAKAVPWILVFATCSMTAVRYASLVADRARATPPDRRTQGIGWEGRIVLVGLAGIFGIATFGYLGLTACLGALIGSQAVIDYLRQGEDQRQ